MMNVTEITDCASDITKYYDELLRLSKLYQLFGEGTHTINGEKYVVDMYQLKKLLYLCIASVNILEGVRFYVSFACSWAFAELKKMEGNAKIIKLIARDENLHLASTQQMIKLLPKDDPDYATIIPECEDIVRAMFAEAMEQEKQWAEYLFKDGSMIGLNAQLLSDYVEWITHKRLVAVGVKPDFSVPRANPLPWTQKWISGAEVQVAPQETEISSYVIGGTKKDVSDKSFEGFSL